MVAASIEHQSKVDRFMGGRRMTYIGLLYQALVKEGLLIPSGRLPLVIPIVLYNGEARDSPASVVRVADLEWTKRLGSFLERRGVPCRIDVHDFRSTLSAIPSGLGKRTSRARLRDRSGAPADRGAGGGVHRLAAGRRMSGCGSHVPLDEVECPNCGLVLDEPEESHAT